MKQTQQSKCNIYDLRRHRQWENKINEWTMVTFLLLIFLICYASLMAIKYKLNSVFMLIIQTWPRIKGEMKQPKETQARQQVGTGSTGTIERNVFIIFQSFQHPLSCSQKQNEDYSSDVVVYQIPQFSQSREPWSCRVRERTLKKF